MANVILAVFNFSAESAPKKRKLNCPTNQQKIKDNNVEVPSTSSNINNISNNESETLPVIITAVAAASNPTASTSTACSPIVVAVDKTKKKDEDRDVEVEAIDVEMNIVEPLCSVASSSTTYSVVKQQSKQTSTSNKKDCESDKKVDIEDVGEGEAGDNSTEVNDKCLHKDIENNIEKILDCFSEERGTPSTLIATTTTSNPTVAKTTTNAAGNTSSPLKLNSTSVSTVTIVQTSVTTTYTETSINTTQTNASQE